MVKASTQLSISIVFFAGLSVRDADPAGDENQTLDPSPPMEKNGGYALSKRSMTARVCKSGWVHTTGLGAQ